MNGTEKRVEQNGATGDNRYEPTNLTRLVGERIRRARRGIGMTQIELAEAMGYSDSSSITYIEQGRNNIKLDALLALCVKLKLSPNDLFGWDGEAR